MPVSVGVQNLTGLDITIGDLGLLIPASSSADLTSSRTPAEIRFSFDLYTAVQADQVLITENGSSLTKQKSLQFLSGAGLTSEQLVFVGTGLTTVASGTNIITISRSPSSGLILPGSGVVVVSGSDSVTVHAPENFSYKIIASGVTVEIPPNQQMIVDQVVEIQPSGLLSVRGELVVLSQVSREEFNSTVSGLSYVSNVNSISGAVTLAGTNGLNLSINSHTITLAPAIPPAIVSGTPDLTVISGLSSITIRDNNRALLGSGQLIVSSGTNTTTLSVPPPIAFISGVSDLTITSGTNSVVVNTNNRALIGTGQLVVSSGSNNIGLYVPPTTAIVSGTPDLTIVSGTNRVTINDNNRAIVGTGQVTVTSGVNTITLGVPSSNAVLGDGFITIVSGTNSIQLSADYIRSGSSNLVVTSGVNFVQIDLGTTVTGLVSIQSTTVTGTTGQFSGTLSGQQGSFSSGLTVSGTSVQPSIYPQRYYFNAGSNVSTNLATALGFLFATVTPIHKADLSQFNQVRFIAAQGAAGSANSRIRLNYATSYQSSAANYNLVLSTAGTNGGVELNISSANQVADSGWLPLRTAAKTDNLFLAVVASGGDGITDPAFGPIYAEFR